MAMGPSFAQVKRLVEYMEQHPLFARNQMQRRYQDREKWLELSNILNSMSGLQKTIKLWRRFWSNKKYKIKKRLAVHRIVAVRRQELGLPPVPATLSILDRRVLHLVWGNESSCIMRRVLRATPRTMPTPITMPADESQPGPALPNVSHEGSQTDVASLPCLTRSIWVNRPRSEVAILSRLIGIVEKRVAGEIAQARRFHKDLKNLAAALNNSR